MPKERPGPNGEFCERLLGLPRGTIAEDPAIPEWDVLFGAGKNSSPKTPVVWDRIETAARAVRRPTLQVWFWPNAAPFAVNLSHDVDEVRWSWRRRMLMAARHPSTMLERESRYWNFDRVVALERKRGLSSSWYFVADGSHRRDPPYRLRDVVEEMRELSALGHEVGVHASYLSFNNAALMERERRAIVDALGHDVTGVRQHFLNFDPEVTWRIQEAAGFAYDASMALNDTSGFSVGLAHPYRPPGRTILEIPLVLMDGQLFWYERLGMEDALRNCQTLAGEVERMGGLLTLNWHQHTFDDYSFPGWWELYERLVDWLVPRGSIFLTAQEACRWWSLRESVRLAPEAERKDEGVWVLSVPSAMDGVTVRLHGANPRFLEADVASRVGELHGSKCLVLKAHGGQDVRVSAGW